MEHYFECCIEGEEEEVQFMPYFGGGYIETHLQEGGYLKIINPHTGRKVNIFGRKGQQILRNYINQLGSYGV